MDEIHFDFKSFNVKVFVQFFFILHGNTNFWIRFQYARRFIFNTDQFE